MTMRNAVAVQGGLIANLPWRTAPRDMRAVSRLLDTVQLDRDTMLGQAVEGMLRQRTKDCRDFFVARGVRSKRGTVLQMACRSLARDPEQMARLDEMAPNVGSALLCALSQSIERQAEKGSMAFA